MLGSMLAEVLAKEPGIELERVSRATGFDALAADPRALVDDLACDWVLNAVGVLRSAIDERDRASVATALAVNRDFPRELACAVAACGSRMIHFSTDAVFGVDGPYDERAPHGGADVYARAKSEGEPDFEQALTLRSSIVGPEAPPARSLLGWALDQQRGATIDGYTDVRWNGLTSWHLARLCAAIVGGRAELPSPLHPIPADSVTKAELLRLILAEFGREDVTVRPVPSGKPADPTLTTAHPDAVAGLWRAAGWTEAPTVAAMVAELATVVASAPPAG